MRFEHIFRLDRDSRQETVTEIFDERFMRRMERIALYAQRFLRGGIAGEHRSLHYIPAAEFSGHRDYTPGDDLRFVDWPAAGGSDDVLVRLGDAPQDVTVYFLLDCSQSMDFGQPTKMLAMQRLAAALVYIALAHGDKTVISPFSTGIANSFGPIQGRTRFTEVLRFISNLAIVEHTSITAALRAAADRTPRGGLLVMISDLLTKEPLDIALRGLILPRWQVLILHLLDPRELEPDLRGNLALEDSETGQQMMYDLDAKTLAEYKRRVSAWCDQIEHSCFLAGASYARFTCDQSLERLIVPMLHQRRLLEGR